MNFLKPSSRSVHACALFAVLMLAAAPLRADQLIHLGALKSAGQYDTNPLMRSDGRGQGDVWVGLIQPMYRGYWIPDERYKLQLDVELRLERSSDQDIIANREDPTVELFWSYRGKRHDLDTTIYRSAIPARLVEFEETGIVGTNGTRTQDKLRGEWDYAWDEITEIRSLADVTRTTYDDIPLIDYTTAQLRSELEREQSDIQSYFAGARLLQLDPFLSRDLDVDVGPDTLRTSRMVSAYGGARYEFSPLWRIDASFGAALSERESRDFDLIWHLDSTYEHKRYEFRAELERSKEPSGVAGLLSGDTLRAQLSYEHSARMSFLARASYRKNRKPNNNESLRFGVEHRYRMTPLWTLTSMWEYKRLQGFSDAEGMVTTVTLEFSPG
jgi:hypothetical protein